MSVMPTRILTTCTQCGRYMVRNAGDMLSPLKSPVCAPCHAKALVGFVGKLVSGKGQ